MQHGFGVLSCDLEILLTVGWTAGRTSSLR